MESRRRDIAAGATGQEKISSDLLGFKPLKKRINRFITIAKFRFPVQIQTVSDTINFVTHPTGYELVNDQKQSNYDKLALQKPLPVIARKLGPLKIINLEVLMGKKVFQLVEAPLNKKVDFKLKSFVYGS